MSPRNLGVSVLVTQWPSNRVLVGKRGPACPRGAGLWALPGGWVNEETIFQAAQREVFEETGLDVVATESGVITVTDHYPRLGHLTVWLRAEYYGKREPRVMEPERCECWRWAFPRELRTLEGACEPGHPQNEWLPLDLFRHYLPVLFAVC